MRWERGRRSQNLEDRRARRAARGPGRARLPLPRGRGGRLSLTGIVILLGIYFLLGPEALQGLGGLGGGLPGGAQVGLPGETDVASGPLRTTPEEEELVEFVSFVLDDAQRTWTGLLPGYREAKLVL